MSKLKTHRQIKKIISSAKNQNRTIGLVTGSFTHIVENHSLLFEFAKRQVDILIVATGNDKVVSAIKRVPFPPFKTRVALLEQVSSIDFIYEIKDFHNNVQEPVVTIYKQLIKELEPDFIFTNGAYDKYLHDKIKASEGSNTKIISNIK
jgi:bifunctional ADP-heptose synthase (sugar kinase/adenylyltransferase)